MAATANSFHDLKQRILDANDLELHFAALIVFNELATRRLGPDSLVLDSSGCAVTVAKKAPRSKTPKKKQEAVNVMFNASEPVALVVGEVVELEDDEIEPVVPNDGGSVSPDPPSEPRPVPERKVPVSKAKGAMRH